MIEHTLKKWDIVKIKEISSKNLPADVLYAKKDSGCIIHIPKSNGSHFRYYLNNKIIGSNVIVYSFNNNSKYQVCGVLGLTPNDDYVLGTRSYHTFTIPSMFLSKPKGRILDSRKLKSIVSRSKFLRDQQAKDHLYNLIMKTKSVDNIFISDLAYVRKKKQLFFPKKKMTLKEIMYSMLMYTNSMSTGFNSFICQNCGVHMDVAHIAATRYVRKDGGITCKCGYCKQPNYISIDYAGDRVYFKLTENKC